MNAIELLEALLRGPAGGPPAGEAAPGAEPRRPAPRRAESRGADILRDILGGGAPEPAAPSPAPRPVPTGGGVPSGPSLDDSEKTDVKELLRQAKEREAAAAAGRPYRPAPAPPARRPERAGAGERPAPQPAPRPRDEEATILIRAMINAARADGRLDREEEQKILQHLGQPSPEMVAFIQAEFQKPLDVREFAWSVPLGLEQKAYALSLAVLELDQREESAYLKDLAHGLRLPPEVCAEIHRQFGAPILT